MIIFNLWAIPILFAIYLVHVGVAHFFPALVSDYIVSWSTGVIVTIIGALTELIGVKGRLFFMPIWFIGLGIICLQLGWVGSVLLGALVVVGIIWLFRYGKKQEAKEWQVAQEKLRTTPVPPSENEEVFWGWVRTAVHLPLSAAYTPEICEHDLKALQAIQRVSPRLEPAEQAHFSALEQFLDDARRMQKPPLMDPKLHSTISDFIRKKAIKARANRPLQTAGDIPPVHPGPDRCTA